MFWVKRTETAAPPATRERKRGSLDPAVAEDRVILSDGTEIATRCVIWGGGIWNWFDPLTLIQAADATRESIPNLRVVFPASASPSEQVPAMRMAADARALSERRGLTGERVFFADSWIPYDERGSVLLEAVAGTLLKFECRGYEVWTPLFPNCVVRIDATLELKKRALACYQSQLVHTDYLHAAIGLNAYRSLALGGKTGQFAEAFHALPLAEYLHFYRAVPASMLT